MTKIMLVEDDKSLREIYGVRLLAEGYDIVSAGDGEEALAMAIKERPQLIVSDVMMPKISGFDMLDILRSTTETRNIKVIMMTALSSEEQRLRGEQLGADRYLVKSQVGIEDVVRTVHEVLEDRQVAAAPSAAPRQVTPVTPPSRSPQPTMPAQPTAAPAPSPVAPTQDSVPKPPSARSRVIQPLNDPSVATVDLNDLLDKELAKEAGIDGSIPAPVVSTSDEQGLVSAQLDNFAANLTTAQPSPADDVPQIAIADNGTVAQPTDTTVPAPTPAPASATPDLSANTAPQPTTPAQPSQPAPVAPQPVTPAAPPTTPVVQTTAMPQPVTIPTQPATAPQPQPAAPALVIPERPAATPVAPPPSFPPAA